MHGYPTQEYKSSFKVELNILKVVTRQNKKQRLGVESGTGLGKGHVWLK